MSSTVFVQIYHPEIPETALNPALVALQAVDDYAVLGWLLVDPNAPPPAPATPYITQAALLSQITAGAAPIGTAVMEASVAAVEAEATVNPTGAWNFAQVPTVAGEPIGSAELATKADATAVEGVAVHDGTAGGGTRPTGYARIRWINPVGTTYARPTNMAAGDVWEHDA